MVHNNQQGSSSVLNIDEQVPKTEIAALLQASMAKNNNMGIDELREVAQTSYETTRRFYRGLTVPSNTILKLLSDYFGWDFKDVQEMAIRDRMRAQYGTLLDLSHNADPDVQKFVKSWPLLNKKQRTTLLQTLSTFLRENKPKT